MGDTSRTLDNLLLPEALEQPRPRLSVGLMEGGGYVPLDIRRATSSRSAYAMSGAIRLRIALSRSSCTTIAWRKRKAVWF